MCIDIHHITFLYFAYLSRFRLLWATADERFEHHFTQNKSAKYERAGKFQLLEFTLFFVLDFDLDSAISQAVSRQPVAM